MESEIGICDRCQGRIRRVEDLGYMGPVDRTSEECGAYMDFETVCATCEESSVVEKK